MPVRATTVVPQLTAFGYRFGTVRTALIVRKAAAYQNSVSKLALEDGRFALARTAFMIFTFLRCVRIRLGIKTSLAGLLLVRHF
jgi:hypothetical protein